MVATVIDLLTFVTQPSADNVQAVEEEIAVQTGQNQEEDEIEEEPEETTTSADVDREITPEPSQGKSLVYYLQDYHYIHSGIL